MYLPYRLLRDLSGRQLQLAVIVNHLLTSVIAYALFAVAGRYDRPADELHPVVDRMYEKVCE